MPGKPDTAESEFRFHPLPGWMAGPVLRWHVHCGGVDWAMLTFHAPEAEWRLSGLGPLQGMAAAWGHGPDSSDVASDRAVPDPIRRDAVAALAMVGLDRLKRSHESLARIRESLGASRAVAREENRGRDEEASS